MPRSPLANAAVLLLAALALAACAEDNETPALHDDQPQITLAYDVELDDAISELSADWPDDQPDIIFEPDSSAAIAVRAAADRDPPDVVVIEAQTPFPDNENDPISTRRWLLDPIVFVARADNQTTTDELLTGENTRFAILHESEALGQYTRFGLRKLDRWELVKDRAPRFSSPLELLDAVENAEAHLTAVYASDLARRAKDHPDHHLAQREELDVSQNARRAFALLVMTPDGVELARWLASAEVADAAARFGYRRDTPPTPEIPSEP